MENKILLKDFVEQYTKVATDSLKKRYIEEKLKVVPYVPYLTKVTLAEKIVKQSSYEKDENGEIIKPERIRVNSALRYVLYVTTIVKIYTNIELNNAEMATEFDMLNKAGLIEVIFKAIPEKEIVEFKTVLDLQLQDFMTNEYDVHAFISNQITRVTDVTKVFLEPVLPMLEELGKKLESMDEKDMEKLSNKVIKMVGKATK